MSVLNTLPAPVIQMGLVEKLVEVEQNQPQVQQIVAQATARESIKKEQSRVSAPAVPEESKKIREREAGQGGRERQGRHRRHGAAEQNREPEDEQPRTRPWSGHIVNIKI